MDETQKIKLEKHDTKDIHDGHTNGSLNVIWRDWDNIIANHPKMVYVTSVYPQEVKGPHLHLKRHSYFTCIQGEVLFIIKEKNGKYLEIKSNSENPTLVHIPPNIATAHINISNDVSKILVLTNIAWRPNDNEMKNVTFDDYDWNKWKN